jgi:hypothetical protein
METKLSHNEVLTLPGGFKPVIPKSLAWPWTTWLSFQSLHVPKDHRAFRAATQKDWNIFAAKSDLKESCCKVCWIPLNKEEVETDHEQEGMFKCNTFVRIYHWECLMSLKCYCKQYSRLNTDQLLEGEFTAQPAKISPLSKDHMSANERIEIQKANCQRGALGKSPNLLLFAWRKVQLLTRHFIKLDPT